MGANTFTDTQTMAGLSLSGTGTKITADFSNATQSSRAAIQTSTTNGATTVSVLPNGTSTSGGISLYGSSNADLAPRLNLNHDSSAAVIQSDISGAASYTPLQFKTGGSAAIHIDTSQRVGFGTTAPISTATIEIVATSGNCVQTTYYGNDTNGAAIAARKARGSAASPSQTLANDRLFGWYGSGYTNSGAWGGNSFAIQSYADENYTSSAQGSRIAFATTPNGSAARADRWIITSSGHFQPGADNAYSLGASSFRSSVVYSATGSINTSDAREKTAVSPLTQGEIEAAKALASEIGAYKFLQAITDKGEECARKHIGMTVQRAIEIMESHGLNSFEYGFICYDEWGEQRDADNNVTCEAGNRYSFRPDELLMFVARGFDARLSALESAVNQQS
jgi:hypothetical protein